ncbi:molybdopterin binding oxidoreductase [Phanerochaete sordida]|uniref:Nitrate reductase [NADPH] n=1 Tax=Phanerochaete sordida TaxID=48140 RepID=A0A9P3LH54_9APHY|nr:molybdopterin binding oxidoreductase [Phanerochaete sordida]
MPHWSQALVEPNWAKEHNVSLRDPRHYDEAARRDGTNKVERHRPLSYMAGQGRPAGSSGVDEEPESGAKRYNPSADDADWKKALEDGSRVVTVRDVKDAVPNFKTVHPRNHAFARFVLPVKSTAFNEQDWPGKKKEDEENKDEDGGDKEEEEPAQADEKKEPEMSPETKKFYDQLWEEGEVQKKWQNNDAEPKEDLKLLDQDAMEQLESTLSVDDQSTPDSWVPRSASLLRLAGAHPLNAEPNITEMFEAGLITPTKLHYVRSHGPVPQLQWETHRLMVFSDPPELIADPKSWTMDELAGGAFKIFEFPVTIACDGNRRKEMSMLKQTSGIGFTAAGVSTCLWRGIHVRDVLLASGLRDQPDHERWHLHFEGADECSEGRYATSIPLMHAMDPSNDVLLAFGQNGRVLHPDHGYPLRFIVPGFVGGRHVKWVHKIWVAKEPNTSHYHIWDNRILPSFITSNQDPLAKLLRYHENTACMDQMLQSVTCKPAHNERVPLQAGKTYTVEGFAYTGTGSNINRVELTLDGGKTWRYCFKRYVDKPLRYGEKHWAWLFWSCEVSLAELANAKEFAVRAVDAHYQVQPEHMVWNMTGMMNNAWYRVRTEIKEDPDTHETVVHFLHPVGPGKDTDGWMKPNPEDVDDGAKGGPGSDRVLSLEEIAKHGTRDDAWIIIDNKVYDVTSVLSWHPGGAEAIMPYAGKATVDTTIQYKGIHDNYANQKRDETLIGVLADDAIEEMEKDAVRAEKELAKLKEERKGLSLQPDLFMRGVLVERKEVSHDTRTYVFELPKKADGAPGVLGLPVGQHVLLALHFADQAVLRPYTPIYPVLPGEEDGTITFCVKTYFPTDGGPHPPGGLVSNYLDCMQLGEELDMRGPMGEIVYRGRGAWRIEGKDYRFDKINLVAGGSGLTPHWQVIHAILADADDTTRISMIDSNKTYADILLRDELAAYAERCPERFRLWHALSTAPEDVPDWPYAPGHLTTELMQRQFYPPGEGVVTLLCGPGGLIEKAAVPGLEEMGFEKGVDVFGY